MGRFGTSHPETKIVNTREALTIPISNDQPILLTSERGFSSGVSPSESGSVMNSPGFFGEVDVRGEITKCRYMLRRLEFSQI